MADLTTVRAKIADALDEADAALNQPNVAAQLAVKDATIADLTTKLAAANANVTALQAKITTAKADEAVAEAAQQKVDGDLA